MHVYLCLFLCIFVHAYAYGVAGSLQKERRTPLTRQASSAC